MNIGTVVEGPTDRLILTAVLRKILPGHPEDHRFLPLQPSPTFGETGTGWKGVRKWCQESWQRTGSSLEAILSSTSGPTLDLLVIHVDADIIGANDLQDGFDDPIPGVPAPCPPIGTNAGVLRVVVTRWLARNDLPHPVVLAIPAEDIETWIFAALFPQSPLCQQVDFECVHTNVNNRRHPGFLLPQKKYGKVMKDQHTYRKVSIQVADSWVSICQRCTQAESFNREITEKTENL